jgi:hypothetical protein
VTRITVEGALVRDALYLSGVDGTAYVEVIVGTPEAGCWVHARQRIGEGGAAQYVGRNKATHLRRGQRVLVVASTLEIVRDSVRLYGVDRIEALDAPVQERVAA